MTLKEALLRAQKQLLSAKIPDARLEAEALLALAIKKNKEFIYAWPEKKLTAGQFEILKKNLVRRRRGEPLAYISGHKEFYGFDFLVNKKVLIPRPESELLVEAVLNFWRRQPQKKSWLVDIGTGSGCLAVALKKSAPDLNVAAVETSAAVLNLAKKNAKRQQVKIKFIKSDFLKSLPKKIQPTIIVANPPYLDAAKKKTLLARQPGLAFEPAGALFAQDRGLAAYQEIIKQIKDYQLQPQLLLLEIGYNQAANVSRLIRKNLPATKIEIIKDYAGFYRAVKVVFNP